MSKNKKNKKAKEIAKMVYPELLVLSDRFRKDFELMLKEIGYKDD